MSIRSRAAGWWSAWKYVAILSALLAGSLWLNLHLYVSKRVDLATAPLKDQVDGLQHARDTAAQLLADGQARERGLINAADVVTMRLHRYSRDYDAAARARPLPTECAPGRARMDATNRALGAPDPEK